MPSLSSPPLRHLLRTGLRAMQALALALLPGLSHAQAGAACDRQSSAQAARNACAVQDFQQADTALSIQYGQLMQALAPGPRTGLRHSQNGWIKARTAGCKNAMRPHEAQPDHEQRYYECLVRATQARMQVLQQWSPQAPPR